MLKVTTETGSIYTIKNGRITRVPSDRWNYVYEDIVDEMFYHKRSLEMGKEMFLHLKSLDRPLRTSAVMTIEEI